MVYFKADFSLGVGFKKDVNDLRESASLKILSLLKEEKAKTFLFDYRLERERNTRAAETFMDIYISVVIAAPMMLMLLLMMIKFGGLGFCGLTTNALTLIMILGVVGINIIFLTFLYLKQPTTS